MTITKRGPGGRRRYAGAGERGGAGVRADAGPAPQANPVERAVRLLGGGLQATLKTGIHPTTLWKWQQMGRIKDGARAFVVSHATGGQVTVEELVGYVEYTGPQERTK